MAQRRSNRWSPPSLFGPTRSPGRYAGYFQAYRGDQAALERTRRDTAVAGAIGGALAEYAVIPGDPRSADALDLLLQEQFYRLAYWRVAVDEVNYRRFFDINDLAGLACRGAAVLGQTHRLAFDMVAAGTLQGLRIDHVDGLLQSRRLLQLARGRGPTRWASRLPRGRKILAPFERLRASWLIAGTTGYEFANLVTGLFVDARRGGGFRPHLRAGDRPRSGLDAIVYDAKRRIMSIDLASELTVLATSLSRIAASDRASSDFT